VEKEIGMNWKPMMSKAEAEEYTEDSYYANRDFYHGTNQFAADSITTEGARIESESVNTYGEGFYLAFAKKTAEDYARLTKSPSVLQLELMSEIPKSFEIVSILKVSWWKTTSLPMIYSLGQLQKS